MTFKGALLTFSEVQDKLIKANSTEGEPDLTALEGLAIGLQQLTTALEKKLNDIDTRLTDLERHTQKQ